MDKINKEKQWVLLCIIAMLITSSIPYIWGLLICPPDNFFLGFTHNIDDGAVYLSWMKQISNGSLLIRNLFTSQAQSGNQINLLFILMGFCAKFLNASLVFHLFRLLFSGILVILLWKLSKHFIDRAGGRIFFVFFCVFSSGIGWLLPNDQIPSASIDKWQPEAITFLSIYLNPMFVAALCLMVSSFLLLLKFERNQKWSLAVGVGVIQFILANIHTYDIITFWIVWSVYVLMRWIASKKFPLNLVKASVIAVLIMLPSVLYQYSIYKSDAVFNARVNTIIPSAPITSVFTGFGIAFSGAFILIILFILLKKKKEIINIDMLLPICWAFVGILIPYIPFAQQRKLIMGAHIPFCILTAVLITYLTRHYNVQIRKAIFAIVLFASIPSNIIFMNNDMKLLAENKTVTIFQPFVKSSDYKVMEYISDKTSANESIFAPPFMSLLFPALFGKQVYYGHWSETPEYSKKINEYFIVSKPDESLSLKKEIIIQTNSKWVILPKESGPSGFTRIAQISDYDIYKTDN